MFAARLSLRRIIPSARLPIRQLSTTPRFYQKQDYGNEGIPQTPDGAQPASDPSTPTNTQGHAQDKAKDSTYPNLDIQSDNASKANQAKDTAQSGNENDVGLDAAKQGSSGGESYVTEAQQAEKDGSGGSGTKAGSFKDQVGGQDEDRPSGEMGGTEPAASGNWKESLERKAGALFGKKEFHSSSRTSYPTLIPANADPSPKDGQGARQPHETNLHGDQNQHLNHVDPNSSSSQSSQRAGNAAENPTLPSKQQQQQKKGYHTSVRVEAHKPPGGYAKALGGEPQEAGYDAPPEALPASLKSAYKENDPSVIQAPPENLVPSSEHFSSTSSRPPNDAVIKMVKEGGEGMGDKNAPPTGEVGKIGLDEAWKQRK